MFIQDIGPVTTKPEMFVMIYNENEIDSKQYNNGSFVYVHIMVETTR
jgi:hypothetical protein